MSARDHVRQMTANRVAHARGEEWRTMADRAAREGDYATFGRAVMRDMAWGPRGHVERVKQLSVMGDWITRRGLAMPTRMETTDE
jgi:hypothetical protein